VTLTAAGTHPTTGYKVELEPHPMILVPPHWTLYHLAPAGMTGQIVTPFSVTTQFHAEGTVKEVVITDKIGRHVVQVAQQAAAGQNTTPGAKEILATIMESGSTNTYAYNIVIHNDGSASVVIRGTLDSMVETRQYPAGTIDTKTLLALLREIGDVSRIPTGPCAKSASFGTTTQISYAGKTSGDLQSIPQQATGVDPALLQASKNLYSFVQTIPSQLKINVMRAGTAAA